MGQDSFPAQISQQGAVEVKDLRHGDGAVTPQQCRHIGESELTAEIFCVAHCPADSALVHLDQHASQRRVAHLLLRCPWSGWTPQKLLVLSQLHHAQGLVISGALSTGAWNTVQIPAVQHVASQLGLVSVELGHSEVTKVR